MIKKFLIFITLIFIYLHSSIYANYNVSNVAKDWFDNYSYKVTKKFDKQWKINFYNLFNDKLNELIYKKDFTESQLQLINDLIKLTNEYSFEIYLSEIESNNKKNLSSYNILNDFKNISYNKDNIFLENWIWYTYSHENELVFPEWVNITKNDLDYNKIYPNSSFVFLRDDSRLWFVINYKKIKLISDSIIFWIPNKYWFLQEIKNDKKELNYETDSLFQNIKNITLNLTKWKSEKEKIKILYNYILDNIEYPESYSLSDSKLFSWIDTFKNKSWICEWYVKLFMYMLNFSNINYTEVKRWYVIDAFDFPQVWHAWIKIWDYYYDITFDDPIWINKTKEFKNYIYYKLPKDLIYTNRYNIWDLPEYIKSLDELSRKKIITNNISPLLQKYKNYWYNILKPYYLKQENWISLDKKLDIENLKKIMWYYEVENFKLNIDWKQKTIINLGYYDLNDNIIEDILIQLNYNLDWHYLLKWKLDNWNYTYRLAYDLNLK